MGEVKAESYQPKGRGAYHFKITKLKPRRVPASSIGGLSCSCSSATNSSRYSSYRSYQQTTRSANCLLKQHRASLSKYRDDEKKLGTVISFLSPEQQSKLGSRKRSSQPSSAAVGRTSPYSGGTAASSVPTFTATGSGAQGQLHSQHAPKKRKTSPEVVDLLDDDDEVCIEGVLGPEQAITKRIREAEGKGEIVEIS